MDINFLLKGSPVHEASASAWSQGKFIVCNPILLYKKLFP